jgi:hypothetical protein
MAQVSSPLLHRDGVRPMIPTPQRDNFSIYAPAFSLHRAFGPTRCLALRGAVVRRCRGDQDRRD